MKTLVQACAREERTSTSQGERNAALRFRLAGMLREGHSVIRRSRDFLVFRTTKWCDTERRSRYIRRQQWSYRFRMVFIVGRGDGPERVGVGP